MSGASEGSTWVVKELLAMSASSKLQLAGSFFGLSTDSLTQQAGWSAQSLATGLDSVMGFLKAKQEMFPPGEVIRWTNFRSEVWPLLVRAGLGSVAMKAGLTIAQNPAQSAQIAFVGASGMMALDVYLTIACPPAGAAAWIFTGVALLADGIGVYSAIRSIPSPVRSALFKKTILQGASAKRFYNWQFEPSDPNTWFAFPELMPSVR